MLVYEGTMHLNDEYEGQNSRVSWKRPSLSVRRRIGSQRKCAVQKCLAEIR